eukprot:1409074-Alexandrium_andersonii.AAC.1
MIKVRAVLWEGLISLGEELLESWQNSRILGRLRARDHGSHGPAFLARGRQSGNPISLALLAL